MRRRAFTLIELLVVVAIIALLISILLPCLSRAKAQARTVVCKSNMNQITKGFAIYAVEWKDCLPGGFNDATPDQFSPKVIMDWLGPNLTYEFSRAPERGTIFKYVGDRNVYRCPAHKLFSESDKPKMEQYTSYTGPLCLTGAPTTMLRSTRYPRDMKGIAFDALPPKDRLDVCIMPAVIVEEDSAHFLVESQDSGWCNIDQISTRHAKTGGLGFIDGHVEHRAMPEVRSKQFIFETTDRRMISAGHCGYEPKFGWIRRQPSDLP